MFSSSFYCQHVFTIMIPTKTLTSDYRLILLFLTLSNRTCSEYSNGVCFHCVLFDNVLDDDEAQNV